MTCNLKYHCQPGVEAQAYNLTYLGGRDWEDCSLRPTVQKVTETASQPIKAGHDGAWLSFQLHKKYKYGTG
jgi:biotin carboxylase